MFKTLAVAALAAVTSASCVQVRLVAIQSVEITEADGVDEMEMRWGVGTLFGY